MAVAVHMAAGMAVAVNSVVAAVQPFEYMPLAGLRQAMARLPTLQLSRRSRSKTWSYLLFLCRSFYKTFSIPHNSSC